MSQLGRVQYVQTNPATQFVSAIAQNAGEYLSLVPGDAGAFGNTMRARIVQVTLRMVENLAWELYFFGSAVNNTATPATNRYLGRKAFLVADGVQIGGAGLFLYSGACDIPLRDDANPATGGRINMMLVNRSALSTAGANRIGIELVLDPTHGG